MSSLPKPTSESPGHHPLEKVSAVGGVPDAARSMALHWQAPWAFAIHACVGILVFAIVAVPAVLLGWSMEWFEAFHPIDPVVILGLRVAEYAIFGTDLTLFLIFLLRTGKRTIREL